MTILEELIRVFPSNGTDCYLTVSQLDWGFEISYGQSYRPPGCTFKQLKDLSDLLGTTDIDVDNFNRAGCETCDYGSDYGYTIQIRNITKNLPAFNSLVGRNLHSKEKS